MSCHVISQNLRLMLGLVIEALQERIAVLERGSGTFVPAPASAVATPVATQAPELATSTGGKALCARAQTHGQIQPLTTSLRPGCLQKFVL